MKAGANAPQALVMRLWSISPTNLANMLINQANPNGFLATSSSPSKIHGHIALWYMGVKYRVQCMYTQICCALWVFYSALNCD